MPQDDPNYGIYKKQGDPRNFKGLTDDWVDPDPERTLTGASVPMGTPWASQTRWNAREQARKEGGFGSAPVSKKH